MWDNLQQLNRLTKALMAFLVIFLLVSGWGYVKQRADWFPLKAVKVDGELNHVTRKQVQLVVDSVKGKNFFALDLNRLHQAFEGLPWIERVSIRRNWQNRMIAVTVVEHQPFARWGETALISQKSKVFNAVMNGDLPMLAGPMNTARRVFEQYKSMNEVLKKADLQIASLTLSERFSWRLVTGNGMAVEMGSTKSAVQNLRKFVTVYKQSAGKWHGKIDYVDLRYKGGFAIKKPSVIEAKATDGAVGRGNDQRG